MPDSYRRRIDETVIYLPINMETLQDIINELRTELAVVPPRLMTVRTDDDGHLVVSVPVQHPWADCP